MKLALGTALKIRSMIHIAAEPLPYFWPMRTFIHHNPLHGLEHLPFEQAVEKGAELFHSRGALPRSDYQRYLRQGRIDRDALSHEAEHFLTAYGNIGGLDLHAWLMHLLCNRQYPCTPGGTSLRLADSTSVHAALHTRGLPPLRVEDSDIAAYLGHRLLGACPVYEAVDAIYGSELAAELDDLVVKSCLDFFDEGQSAWNMPEREQGFFSAWRDLAQRNARFFLRGLHIGRILDADDTPEGVIAYVLEQLGIPGEYWVEYFSRELAHLHGWAGFIRWRSSATHYFWSQQYPADLVDFMAVRLSLALAILNEGSRHHAASTQTGIAKLIENSTHETYLRHELHSRNVMPEMALQIEMAIASRDAGTLASTYDTYVTRKREQEAATQSDKLKSIAAALGQGAQLDTLDAEQFASLVRCLREFEHEESMIWLRSMEAKAIGRIIDRLNITPPKPREKRPFAQALFCIDTRSERIRRHLETVGDYQTFGIAGFFGVPVSFMELGKGSETHLCPVLLTPKNLVTEVSLKNRYSEATLSALGHAMHELKASVLSPFVTVEAIGLLFGFDMVGKTIAPQTYTRWRKRLEPEKPTTRLLLDKLDREQADSIVRAVQRAMILAAIQQKFGMEPGRITDTMIRELRESALGHQSGRTRLAEILDLDEKKERDFIQHLRHVYHINPPFAQLQLERLGRIGFTLEEQALFVGQALRAIGLTKDFSRFVLLVGHGSTSENNPFESALDCGACGGNHGIVSARVLAQMANKQDVRERLRQQGIEIPGDTFFIAAMHDTTTDKVRLHHLELLPPSHLVYLDRLLNGVNTASRLCAQERVPTLEYNEAPISPAAAIDRAVRNSMDWSQVRPEWGLSRNSYFFIGRRNLTRHLSLEGRAFLHSYDYRVDPNQRLLETILTGPLVVAQWINMEHYFSTVDNERFGSGSKAYHNVAGRFGVMTGNQSDLRTGLPSQTVLKDGKPFHEPVRLITVIEAPLDHAERAIDAVATVKRLIVNGWLRLMVIDPESRLVNLYEDGAWRTHALSQSPHKPLSEEAAAS